MQIKSKAKITLDYRKFNSLFFNNTLPNDIKFSLANVIGFYGQARYKNKKLELRINSNIEFINETTYENTLIHEMIHIWQFVNYNTMDHLNTFKNKANEIYTLSNGKYNITRVTNFKEKGYVINNKIKKMKLFTI